MKSMKINIAGYYAEGERLLSPRMNQIRKEQEATCMCRLCPKYFPL